MLELGRNITHQNVIHDNPQRTKKKNHSEVDRQLKSTETASRSQTMDPASETDSESESRCMVSDNMDFIRTHEKVGVPKTKAGNSKGVLPPGPGYDAKPDLQSGLAGKGRISNQETLPKQALHTNRGQIEISPSEHGDFPHNRDVSHRPIKGLGDLAASLNIDTPQASHNARISESGHFTRQSKPAGEASVQSGRSNSHKSVEHARAYPRGVDAGRHTACSKDDNYTDSVRQILPTQNSKISSSVPAGPVPQSVDNTESPYDALGGELGPYKGEGRIPFAVQQHQAVGNQLAEGTDDLPDKGTREYCAGDPRYRHEQQNVVQPRLAEAPHTVRQVVSSPYSNRDSHYQTVLDAPPEGNVYPANLLGHASIDMDTILEELTRRIQRDYKRFYRS